MAQQNCLFKYTLECRNDKKVISVTGDSEYRNARCPVCNGSEFTLIKIEGGELKYTKSNPYPFSHKVDTIIKEVELNGDYYRVIQHSDNIRSLKINDIGYSFIYTDNTQKYEPVYLGIQKYIKSLNQKKPLKNICILGGGGGTLIRFIIKNIKSVKRLDSVEINPIINQFCREYFIGDLLRLKENQETIQLINADAFDFVRNLENLYDFIYVDLYYKDLIPFKAFQENFIADLKECLCDGGVVAFNMAFSDKYEELLEIGKRFFSDYHVLKGHTDEEKYVVLSNRNSE